MLELQWRYPLLSLQEMSLLRITTSLCNSRQLLKLILKCKMPRDPDNRLYAKRGEEWAAIQKMANELVSRVCKCTKLKEMILNLVWTVYYRITRWKCMYAPSIPNQFLHFSWTDQGKVDTIRTARYLIRNMNISVRKRFAVACKVCLYEEIREQWEEMSDDDKMYFCAKKHGKNRLLHLFWVHVMNGTNGNLDDLIFDACLSAFHSGLTEAFKYLFAITICPEDEKKQMASMYTEKLEFKFNAIGFLEENEIDILHFLYFKVKDVYSGNFLLEMPLLLQFSEREHFFNVLAERLPSAPYRHVMAVFDLVCFSYNLEIINSDDYDKIIVYFWRNIPASMKYLVANTNLIGHFLNVLIRDNFPFLVKEEAFKIEALLTSPNSKPSTAEMPFGFHKGKWKILHFLIEEGIATIESLMLHREVEREAIPVFNNLEWNRVLTFVRNIQNKGRDE